MIMTSYGLFAVREFIGEAMYVRYKFYYSLKLNIVSQVRRTSNRRYYPMAMARLP